MNKNEILGIIIKNGKKIIKKIMKQYNEEQRLFNEILKENNNLFWRPTYVKRGKKVYHYWYKYEWDSEKKRTIHKYIGKIKPNEELPDPPKNPLKNIKFKEITGSQDIILSTKDYNLHKEIFKNCKIQYITKT